MRANGSAKTVSASSKATRCFLRFSDAFVASHSNCGVIRYHETTIVCRAAAKNSRGGSQRLANRLKIARNVVHVGGESDSVRCCDHRTFGVGSIGCIQSCVTRYSMAPATRPPRNVQKTRSEERRVGKE